MLNKEMEAAINDQINYELYSAYIYFGMSSALDDLSFKGSAHWMRVQANEELFHAAKFFDYVHSRDGKVTLKAIPAVKTDWDSLMAAFEEAYVHEQSVTARICNLTDLALSTKDHVTNSMLQWFLTEQIEEENNVKTIIDRLKRIQTMPDALYQLDTELGARPLSAMVNLINTTATTA